MKILRLLLDKMYSKIIIIIVIINSSSSLNLMGTLI